jgi:hypothetical protein
MQEAFLVLARAKREAEARVRRYETEGKASVHKIPAARHAVRSIEAGYECLKLAQRIQQLGLTGQGS